MGAGMESVLNLIRGPLQGRSSRYLRDSRSRGALPQRKALKAHSEPEDRWLPLVLHFQPSAETYLLARYLMELTLVDYEMVHYNLLEIAAAALCLSRKVVSQGQWVSLSCRQGLRKFCTPFPKASEFPCLRLPLTPCSGDPELHISN